MADQIRHQGYPEQSGLEAAPVRYSTAPIPYDPPVTQSPGDKPAWTASQSYSDHHQPPPPEKHRVFGLTVPVFWGIVIALAVILAGGIAGGVAGGLAAQSANSSSASTSSAATTAGSQSDPSATSSTRSGSSSTSSKATSTSTTSRAVATGVLPAPTDGGCPGINQTTYTPTNAGGKGMAVGNGDAQVFRQLCEVNYPSGAAYGNPGLYDILKVYVPSFEECMALCAAHNQAYSVNLANGNVRSGGYCRSVAMIKLAGEYCYLKNGTGVMNTQGHPQDFVSAVILSGLPEA